MAARPDAAHPDPAPGPLAGLRVVDCSTVLAGPYCTMLLGDLGADVVKIEPPEGDATRGWGPPWVGPADAEGRRTAAYYLAVNRNKRGMRLDLKAPEGASILRRLLADGDVLVENARVGGFARLGFDDATLEAINPRLVHLAISGYGTTGAAATRPGYDFVIQAASGLMSITGAPDDEGGGPTKVGVAISDVVSGMLGAVSVLAALVGRERDGGPTPGRGQRIDISLLGATMASLVNQAQNAFVSGVAPGRLGNAHPNIVPYETFATADGAIAIAVGLGAPVATAVRRARGGGAGAGPAVRHERRPGRAAGRAASDPRRPLRGALDRRLADGARRGRDPVRADQRRRSPRSPRPRRSSSG